MDVAKQCIRCGSTTHSTREHDEGKIPGVASDGKKPAKRAHSASVGKKKDEVKKNDVGPSAGVRNLFVHHDRCWSRPMRNPGIPDVVDPPFRMQLYEDPCIASWQSRDECLCKECEKKRKKVAFQQSQKKKRIADRGRSG